MKRILALDVGEKRIGVAISDPLNISAQGMETITRESPEDTINKIETLSKEYNISKVIVGMPLNMNGSKGKSAKLVEEFVIILRKKLPVEIGTVDERLSSKQGERILLEADVSRKKRKLSIDKIAAQLILQTYLDSNV